MNVIKSTFRVLFYLRKNEVNKSGNSSIMVRITVNGEQVQFSSKLQIKHELWDTKKGKAVGKSAAAMNTNRLLDFHFYDFLCNDGFFKGNNLFDFII